MSDGGAFNGLFVPDSIADATSDRAWLQARRPLRDELIADEVVCGVLGVEGVERALDPLGYLGSAEAFVYRALDRYGADGT